MIFLPHINTVILLEPYCGTITEPGLPVIPLGLQTTECPGKVQWLLKWSQIFLLGQGLLQSSCFLDRILWTLVSQRNEDFSIFRAFSVRLSGLSTPTAFTAAVISDYTCFFFKLVTLLVNLLCRMAKFSSTFSVKIEISEALKLCFQGLRDPSPEAILVLFAGCKLACEPQTHFRSSPLSLRKIAIFRRERSDDRKCVCGSQASCKQQTRKKIPSVLWDANLELVTVNPRLTNLSFNPALNNAILTRS